MAAARENDNHPLTNGTYDESEPIRTDFGPNGPQPGTAAYTAFIMAQLYPDEPDGFWDDFKEDLKEGRI